MIRAVLSVGSNMDDRRALIEGVFADFAGETIARSSIYATPPWGVTDQDEFLNAVLIVETEATPMALLRRCQSLENAAERKRTRRWGPRTLDVDVVRVDSCEDGESCVTEVRSEDPVLTLPHPYAHQRAFVLIPWLEADPQAQLNGTPLAELLARIPEAEKQGVRRS